MSGYLVHSQSMEMCDRAGADFSRKGEDGRGDLLSTRVSQMMLKPIECASDSSFTLVQKKPSRQKRWQDSVGPEYRFKAVKAVHQLRDQLRQYRLDMAQQNGQILQAKGANYREKLSQFIEQLKKKHILQNVLKAVTVLIALAIAAGLFATGNVAMGIVLLLAVALVTSGAIEALLSHISNPTLRVVVDLVLIALLFLCSQGVSAIAGGALLVASGVSKVLISVSEMFISYLITSSDKLVKHSMSRAMHKVIQDGAKWGRG